MAGAANPSLALLRAAVETTDVGVLLLNAQLEPVVVNEALRRMHGHEHLPFQPGAYPAQPEIRLPDGQPLPPGPTLFERALADGHVEEQVFGLVHHRSRALRTVYVTGHRLDDEHGDLLGLLFTFIDNTERTRTESDLRRLAERDPLTGLLNRRGLLRLGTELLVKLQSEGRQASLWAFDVDGLKAVNDQHGHATGDRLLRGVAAAAQQAALEAGGLAARVGGDEFVLLAAASEPAGDRFVHLVGQVQEELLLPEPARVTVGVADSYHLLDLRQMLHRADADMYAVRAARRGAGSSHPSR